MIKPTFIRISYLSVFWVIISFNSVFAQAIDCETQVQKAREISWRHEYNKAKELYQECHILYPQDVSIILGITQVYFWQDNITQAEQWVQKGLTLDPSNSELKALEQKIHAVKKERTLWDSQFKLALSLEEESHPFELGKLSRIQDLSETYTLTIPVQSNSQFKLIQGMVRNQEDLLTYLRNQSSTWENQLGLGWTQTISQFQVSVESKYHRLENAWDTRYPIKDPTEFWTSMSSAKYENSNWKIQILGIQDQLRVKNFSQFQSEYINRSSVQGDVFYKLPSQQVHFQSSRNYWDSTPQDIFRLGHLYQDKLIVNSYLLFSRFEDDSPRWNSHDLLLGLSEYVAYPWQILSNNKWLFKSILQPGIEFQIGSLDEGKYGIDSSLDGLPRPTDPRWIYSAKPELKWTVYTQPHHFIEFKTQFYQNSDDYIAWSAQILQSLRF